MGNENFDFNELEEILKRVRENGAQEEESNTDELLPPEPLAPPEINEPEIDEDELEWHDENEQASKISKPDKEVIKINFKTRLVPKLKVFAKKVFTRLQALR